MRRWPAPLRVTLPPPSSTTTGEVLTTLAVWVITIVTGSGPQSNVITPPAATAATTASEVQLAGVPVPMTRSGFAVLTGSASGGSGPPPGLPGFGSIRRSAVTATVAGPSTRSIAAATVAPIATTSTTTQSTVRRSMPASIPPNNGDLRSSCVRHISNRRTGSVTRRDGCSRCV